MREDSPHGSGDGRHTRTTPMTDGRTAVCVGSCHAFAVQSALALSAWRLSRLRSHGQVTLQPELQARGLLVAEASERGSIERGSTGPSVIARLGRVLALLAFVVLSLLSFPAAIPHVLAAWLAWASWRIYRGQAAGWILVGATAVVLAKRTVLLPGAFVHNDRGCDWTSPDDALVARSATTTVRIAGAALARTGRPAG